jgi:hypothetical protein
MTSGRLDGRLSDRAVLDAADALTGRPPTHWAAALTGDPGLDVAALDARMVELHRRRFGPLLEARTRCEECGEELELSLPAGELVAEAGGEAPLAVPVAGLELELRPPRPDDLAAVAAEPGAERARALLAERCVVAARPAGAAEPAGTAAAAVPSPLPPEAVDAIGEALAARDPAGGSRLRLTCPACGREWEEALDLPWIVGSELASEAERIAAQVHALASAYGWTEAEVLSLPAARRRRYLELVTA